MLRELGDCDPSDLAVSPGDQGDEGLGVVEAARGCLTHRASLRDGVISGYQILAPTEWNFHPEGSVAKGLSGFPCGDEAIFRRQADLFINAVDPCVGYRLEFL
jgi:uptake hydrogenase large subunit